MKDQQKLLRGKVVFIAGGSSGLGLEIAKLSAAQGAHITIFARRKELLEQARKEILAVKLNEEQEVNALSLDLGNASEVHATFKVQARLPDILYCAAGGTGAELGFFTDIDAKNLDSCMRNNYFTAAYSAQSIWNLWLENDKERVIATPRRHRQIVFINSAAAFLGLPGYAAYTASKCAVRGLADTLRMEALRSSNKSSKYTIHCAFPSNFISDAFLSEQLTKPELLKKIEGTEGTTTELQKKYPSSRKVAETVIAGAARGDFALCDDSLESGFLFSNMVGPSPKRGLGILDSVMGTVASLVIWPVLRRQWDALCEKDGNRARATEGNDLRE